MATVELITEQHGIDEDGNHWILIHQDSNEWKQIEWPPSHTAGFDEVLDRSSQ